MLDAGIENPKPENLHARAGKKNEEILVREKKKKISVRGEKKHKKSVRGGENSFPYLRAFKTVYTGNRMTDITVFSDRIEKKITDRCHSNWRSV